jgi:anion-transporting  ArsA/GET3 family ATPase
VSSQSKVTVFCGKGGVGKTTLALAHGLSQANRGRSVLVVSSHPLAELAVAVSLDGLSSRFPIAAKNLFVVHIDARELLTEVVQKNFPVEWIANAVLKSSIYQNLIEVAPGLKEFYFLARMQALAERTASGVPQYELLLWDAPATGHFVATLDAARNFETFLTGPLSAAGAELHRFFSNLGNISLYPTTTLEEMAVEETIELCAIIAARFGLAPRAVLANMVSPIARMPESDVDALRGATDDSGFRFAIERGELERSRLAELQSRLRAPAYTVERSRDFDTDLDLLDRVGTALEGVPDFA